LIVSQYDKRKYLSFTLDNGLRVLLVEDGDIKKTAVAATVAAGHFADPENCLGLAHLLEHMLFLGSKNFPQANGLNEFLSHHGGSINAWTGTEYSSFHFDISSENFAQGIAHFADMLTYPLLLEEKIEKEISAIDAEFRLKQKDDLRRLYQVHKETCNPAHPFSKFSVGNAQTLRAVEIKALKKQLREFHQRHYVAKNICLCVVSNIPLLDCQKVVAEQFAVLSSKKEPARKAYPALYLPEQLAVKISIRPITEARRLIVTFALPDIQPMYRTKPTSLLSHLLGDEGSGSLLDYFKQQNWASNLSAGGGIQGANFKDFNLNLQLTELGANHIDEILNCLFHYLRLIEKQGLESWRLAEKRQLCELAFNFSDSAKAIDDAVHLSGQMFNYPQQHLLVADYLLDKPDMEIVKQMLAKLSPHNMRLKVILPEIETNRQAKWYDTPYAIVPIDGTLLKKLSSPIAVTQLQLPKANPYLAEHSSRQTLDPAFKLPQNIITKPGMSLWFGQDHDFLQPRGDCFLSFDCQAVNEGIDVIALKRLWAALVHEQLSQQYYQASVAGLNLHFYSHQGGFSLHTSGFSHKQLDLVSDLSIKIHQALDFSERFEQVKFRQWKALSNSLLNKPINSLFNNLSVILQRNTHSPSSMEDIIKHATLKQMDEVRDKLFSAYHLEGLIYGDWQAPQVQSLGQLLEQHRHGQNLGGRLSRDVLDLRAAHTYIFEMSNQHDDNAAVLYFQAPSSSPQDIALTILLEQLMAAPFFQQLRTDKQLGYMVGSGYMPINQHPGISFYIQSPLFSGPHLINEMQGFLNTMLLNFTQLEGIWNKVKKSVINQLRQNDTNLSMKSQRLWIAIGNEDKDFCGQRILTSTIEQLQFSTALQFYQNMLASDHFGKLILYCNGRDKKDKYVNGQIIENIDAIKKQSDYFK
jgi:insulysin